MIKRGVKTGILVALAGVAAGAVTGAANAADLDQIIYAPELNRVVPVEIGNGWYLRGDIGYSVETKGDFGTLTFQGDEYDADDFDRADIDSEVSGGIGAGYQFTDFLRADATAEYSEGEGFLEMPGVVGEADFDAITLMANAYVDLGTFVGLTPYVGAGVGATRVDWGPVRASSVASLTPIELDGAADWRLTYALMAGVAYDLSKSLKLDVGYRYINVAEGSLYSDSFGSGEDDGYAKHEIRAGLRYSLW